MPFGLTNAVPAFQRVINEFIDCYKPKGFNVYLDNITVGGMDQASHDENLNALKEAAKKENFTFNEDKCQYNRSQIQLLGHLVGNGEIKPDPERIAPLKDLEVPKSEKDLQRILGLFNYLSKWVPNFSKIIRPLVQNEAFSLSNDAISTFHLMQNTVKPLIERHPVFSKITVSNFCLCN